MTETFNFFHETGQSYCVHTIKSKGNRNICYLQPSWVDPSFGGFSETLSDTPSFFKRPTAKRQKKDDSCRVRTGGSSCVSALRLSSKMTWVEKYTPQSRADLAVHSKKVDDVYAWLENSLKKRNKVGYLVVTSNIMFRLECALSSLLLLQNG